MFRLRRSSAPGGERRRAEWLRRGRHRRRRWSLRLLPAGLRDRGLGNLGAGVAGSRGLRDVLHVARRLRIEAGAPEQAGRLADLVSLRLRVAARLVVHGLLLFGWLGFGLGLVLSAGSGGWPATLPSRAPAERFGCVR